MTFEGGAPSFQEEVRNFVTATFGDAEAGDRKSRAARMLEEALELAQASGLSGADAAELTAYVFARPVGDIRQEVGGAYVALAGAASALGVNLQEAGRAELDRNWGRQERLRAKHQSRVPGSALPGNPE